MLALPRADGLALEIPPAGPELCETCRRSKGAGRRYCSRLCAMFDASLEALADAYRLEDGDRMAPAVVRARTVLRAVAAVYDGAAVHGGNGRWLAADWADDVAAGELLPLSFERATAEVRRAAGIG